MAKNLPRNKFSKEETLNELFNILKKLHAKGDPEVVEFVRKIKGLDKKAWPENLKKEIEDFIATVIAKYFKEITKW